MFDVDEDVAPARAWAIAQAESCLGAFGGRRFRRYDRGVTANAEGEINRDGTGRDDINHFSRFTEP